MNRKGALPEMLKAAIIALVLLLIYLAFTGKVGEWYQQTILINRCTADIQRMHRLPSVGEGIRCPTLQPEIGKTSPERFVARQMALCGQRYGLFELDPFEGTAADQICLVCGSFHLPEVRDIDLALLNEQKDGKTAYTFLTGKASTRGLQTVFAKTRDQFPEGRYAVVWVRTSVPTIEQWLALGGMQRKRELWHGNLLEIIPGDTIQGTYPIIGAGTGIFAPDQEGLNQAILFLPSVAATHCLTLDNEPWKPPI